MKSPEQRHESETKIRLTDAEDALLQALADYHGLPKAVLGRQLILRGLRNSTFTVPRVPEKRLDGSP